jgi:hypothetical protein
VERVIADHFAPIPCPLPEVRKYQRHVAMTVLEPVVPARVQPCYEGMDDCGAYAQTLPRHREPLEGGLWLDIAGAA